MTKTLIKDFATYWRSAVMDDIYSQMKYYLQQECGDEYEEKQDYHNAMAELLKTEPADLGFYSNNFELMDED